MRVLRRLAIWGSAATFALILVAIASYAQPGTRRAAAAASPATATTSKGDAQTAQLTTRLPEIDAETRRLADAVRALTSEREKLNTRIGTLERNLDDLTGSVKRDPAGTPAAAAPPSGPSATLEPAASSAPVPTAPEQPPLSLERIAALPAATPEAPSEPSPTEFGVDVGGATNFDGLRVLWTSLKNGNTALFEGLHPQVVVRENNRTKAPELRLVVGPIANVEAASRMCAALSTAKRYCQPVAFEGQRLAEAEVVVPERKAESKPERSKPATKSKPAPAANTTPSVLRLFR
jgi:hypothetical protein